MKGVILAGGLGTRLLPMTRVTNKHLLPVYDRPMIYFPIQQLVHAGITDILVVTGGSNAGDFLKLLRNGREFGLKDLSYAYQEGEGGIAEALGLANVDPRVGYAEDLPVEDGEVDIVISNGVINLTPDKAQALGEMARVLKPTGRLQIGDITIDKAVPEAAKQDIALWTG